MQKNPNTLNSLYLIVGHCQRQFISRDFSIFRAKIDTITILLNINSINHLILTPACKFNVDISDLEI